jgi:hypothetical protein
MTNQILTLVAVLIGALASFLSTSWLNRSQHRSDLDRSWRLTRLESYRNYLRDAKTMRTIAQRMAAGVGLDDQAAPLERAVSSDALAQADADRSAAYEMVALTGSCETLAAAHILNRALWRLDWFARGRLDDNDRPGWQEAMRAYMVAIDAFHEAARRDMGVPGAYRRREPEIPPNVLYEQERRNSCAPHSYG